MSSRFVISDEDYQSLRNGLEKADIVKQVLFHTAESEGEVPFSKALGKLSALRRK